LHMLSKPHRRRRAGEWTGDKAVTFIVTLAATGSVTLAAGSARMSRKSAYALKTRDPAFAAAWGLALNAAARRPGQGNKVEEVHEPPVPPSQGDTGAAMPGAWRAGDTGAAMPGAGRAGDTGAAMPGAWRAGVTPPSRLNRERDFARLISKLRGSTPLAEVRPAQ